MGSPFNGLYEVWQKQYTSDNSVQTPFVPEIQALINQLLLRADQNFPDHDVAKARMEVTGFVGQIASEWLKKERKLIGRAIAVAEQEGDSAEVQRQVQQLQALM